MKIIIGADIVPTASNREIFENGDVEKIISPDLIRELNTADYRIFNLEVPLTDEASPIEKCGPCLIASKKSVNGIKATGVDFLTLANNHILDQGVNGLHSTLEALKSAEIPFGGVGENLYKASEPYIAQIGNKKIGIYCCCEHEFSVAGENTPGANPFDPLESLDHISALKAETDYVICLYHAGKEHYRYPSPNLQKICRKIAQKGADLVVCQHSHCVGCQEKYDNSTIIYGQGNFLFDRSESEFWKTSVLICLDTESGEITYIPIEKDGNGVKLSNGENGEKILNAFNERSEEIKKDGMVDEKYKKFAKEMINGYMLRDSAVLNFLPLRILNKLLSHKISDFIAKRKIKRFGLTYTNLYECEAHRELILKGLEKE